MSNFESSDEAYLGSVRFFKHLILTVLALMILVPVCLCVILGVKNKKLAQENASWREQNAKLELEQKALKEGLEMLNQEAEVVKAPSYTTKENKSAEQLIIENTEDWKLILVNEFQPLDPEFEVELVRIAGGQEVDIRIKEDLEQMMADMRKEGLRPLVCSGYRDLKKQTELFEDYIQDRLDEDWTYEDAFYKAKKRLAPPGNSEHHTGLAIDIVGMRHQGLDAAQANTKEAIWLAENCAKYGFILRYPKDKQDITGIEYESWHFRYVGTEAAAYIMEHGITLEEFLSTAQEDN